MALMSHRARAHTWLLAIVLAVCGVALVAQQRSVQPAPAEPLDAAREVRALRTELRQAAADIVAAQAVVGRMQLVDGRRNFLAGQLAEARREIGELQGRRDPHLKALKHADDGIASGATGFDHAIAQARSELAEIDAAERVLRARESQLNGQMTSEEQRWVALEARLAKLEAAGR